MKLFFDESGQTGCVIPNRNGEFYRRNQRFFVLAGIACKNDEDYYDVSRKYEEFLKKYEISGGEFKGTELLKPENMMMLDDFIENLLDDEHVFICCYDKVFYLASMISTYFLGRKTMVDDPILYFTHTSALARENQKIFFEFCKALDDGSSRARRCFVEYIMDYPYEKLDQESNMYLMAAAAMLKIYGEDDEMPEFPLPKGKGAYLNDNITHLINLNALGEMLLSLEVLHKVSKEEMDICHDHIIEFEEEFNDTLRDYRLRFEDSKKELLLQYADNVASVFRRIYTETTEVFGANKQWEKDKQYYPRKLAAIMKKVTEKNIKFVTAISDWALPIAVAIQFDEKTPASAYNNKAFMSLLMMIRNGILDNITSVNYDVE